MADPAGPNQRARAGILALMLGGLALSLLLLQFQGVHSQGRQSQDRQSQGDVVSQMDRFAKARDVAGLRSLIPETEALARAHVETVARGGAYGTGRFGWSVVPMDAPDGERYAVLTTYLTSQDVGDMVFEIRDGKVARYLEERLGGGWRILNHAVDVRFDVPRKTARIENTINVQIPGRTDRPLILRLSPHYKVTSVTSNGKAMRYVQGGGCVLVPDAANQMGTIPLTLRYEGVVDKPTFAGGIMAEEASLTNDYWMPMVGRLPAPFTLRVTGPKDWVAIGQGQKIGEKVLGQERVTQFKMSLPVVYTSVSIGKYKTRESVVNGRTYRVWAASLTDAEMDDQLRFMAPVHEWYEATFGKAPFDGYGALVSKPYGGGALEAYSFATYGEGWLPDEDAHEPAHTWFGGILNNTYLRSFWNESLAVYCEGLYGRSAPIGNRQEREAAFVQDPEVSTADARVPLAESGAFTGGAASDLGYGKGAYVLQMLEAEVGRDAMVKAIRTWLEEHPKGEITEWEDFEAIFLRLNGTRYQPFFDDWLRKPGRLNFKISGVRWEAGTVRGDIEHVAAPLTAWAEVDLVMPDGSVQKGKIDLKQTTFTLPSATKPSLVSVDPRRILYRAFGRDEVHYSLSTALRTMRTFKEEASFTFQGIRLRTVNERPADLHNVMIVAHPDRSPLAKELCAKVGFVVDGDRLTYKGTTIDLKKGAAFALVDLPDNKRCVIALGNARYFPQVGRARLVLVDELGRFLRGETEVKRTGGLTFPL